MKYRLFFQTVNQVTLTPLLLLAFGGTQTANDFSSTEERMTGQPRLMSGRRRAY